MARNRPPNWFTSRRFVVVGALVGWLVILMVASGRPVATDIWVGLPDMSDFVSVLWLMALVAGIVVILRSSKASNLPPQATRRGRWFMWVIMALILLLVATDPDFLDRLRADEDETAEFEEPEPVEVPEGDVPPPPDIQVEPIHVYILLALLGGTALFMRWNQQHVDELAGGEPDEEQADVHHLSDVVERARNELIQSGEPRQRVLAAYAEVENALAVRELPRLRAETPSEHVGRVLVALPIDPTPLVNLGHLYERARFSDHEITVDDQHQAAADLERTTHELAGVADRRLGAVGDLEAGSDLEAVGDLEAVSDLASDEPGSTSHDSTVTP